MANSDVDLEARYPIHFYRKTPCARPVRPGYLSPEPESGGLVKPKPLSAEHVRYGVGQVLSVRELDNAGGVFVADVKFADGTQRTIRLAPQFWVGDISNLISSPPPPPPKRVRRAKKKRAEPEAE